MSVLPNFSVKWNGKNVDIKEATESYTVGQFKELLYKHTRVLPERQKLMGLKHKGEFFFQLKFKFYIVILFMLYVY